MFSSAMAKKSYKQQRKSEKVQVGCMSGLMRMLDFRRHPKLLSDGRVKRDPKGSEDIHGTITETDDKECRAGLIFSGRPSIKTLMEEEMASNIQPLKQEQINVTGICFDDIDLNLATSLIEIYRNRSKGQEISNLVESDLTSDSTGKGSSTEPSTHINQIRSKIQRALEDVAEAVIRHQSANTKYKPSSGEARFQEFVDALQLLSSNKELFLMLVQDPSSRLLESLQNLYLSLGSIKLECEGYDGEAELEGMAYSLDQSVASPTKLQRRQNSFLMEDKLVMRKPPKLNDNSRGLSRIVILKPSPARSHNSLISSTATSSPLSNHTDFHVQEGSDSDCHFSLRELKRRLKLAVGDNVKDSQLNSMSSTFHKAEVDSSKQLPVGSMLVASTDSSDSKIAEEPSMVDKRTVPEDSGNVTRNDATHGVGSFSYEKAKMYLSERLNSQGEDSSPIVQKSQSFEILISLPENDTFSPSYYSEEKVGLAHECTSALNLHTVEKEDSSASPNQALLYQETVSAQASNLTKQMLVEPEIIHGDESLNAGTISHELNNKGVQIMHDIVENPPLCTEDETLWERVGDKSQDEPMNALPEVALLSTDGSFTEQENHSPSDVVQSVKPSVLTCPCSPENTIDREEKLSPQSVLDSVVGDITSPIHKSQNREEVSKPTSRVMFKDLDTTPASCNGPQVAILDDKDARVSFIKAVLQASGHLSEEEISLRWYTEESPLDISALAEVGNLYCLTDDAVLLFDCVEEVLLKIRNNFFVVYPGSAFLKHNVRSAPVGSNLVHEVVNSIDSLVSNEFPNGLDQVIMKDLEIRSWMDVRHDAEGVAIELWDGLLDDLLEEMVFDLWL